MSQSPMGFDASSLCHFVVAQLALKYPFCVYILFVLLLGYWVFRCGSPHLCLRFLWHQDHSIDWPDVTQHKWNLVCGDTSSLILYWFKSSPNDNKNTFYYQMTWTDMISILWLWNLETDYCLSFFSSHIVIQYNHFSYS